MTDVSFVDLVVRMVLSLAVVLGLMLAAYWYLRRRQGFAPIASARSPRSPRLSRTGQPARSTLRSTMSRGVGGAGLPSLTRHPSGARRGLRVLGRVAVGRTTQVVAVQFADKVFLMAASDQAPPTVLAELDHAAWLEATERLDDEAHAAVVREPIVREPIDPTASRPTGLLESLREATTRRG